MPTQIGILLYMSGVLLVLMWVQIMCEVVEGVTFVIIMAIYQPPIHPSRTRIIQDARVTAAVWGPLDQYFVTGDDVGALTKYDIINVRISHRRHHLNISAL